MADRRWLTDLQPSIAMSHQPSDMMSSGPDGEQPLAVLHRLAVLHADDRDLTVVLGVDFVHQLHRFDDAEHVAFLHRRPDLDERRRSGFRGTVERGDDRRLDDGELDFRVPGVRGGGRRRDRLGRRRGGGGHRHDRRRRRGVAHDVRAVGVLADLQPQPVVLDFELRQIVLAHEVENLFDLVEVHHTSIRSVVTSVSTSTPVSVTSTSSSMRTPPHPGRYAPGSIVKIIPVATASSSVSTSGRLREILGSSCTSTPSPCPVPWPNASASPYRPSVSRAAASMSNLDRPGATAAIARSRASRTAAWTSRARALARPADTVRVKSTQYES